MNSDFNMPKNERSRDLAQRPNAVAWLKENSGPAGNVFNDVVRRLRGWYTGQLDGYVNIAKPVQYRFGGPQGTRDYVIVRGFISNFTRISVMRPGDKDQITFQVRHNNFEADFQSVLDYFAQHKIADFDVTYMADSKRQFDEEVAALLMKQLSVNELREMASKSPAVPKKISHTSQGFERNRYVVAARLAHANGACEDSDCVNRVPFKRKDGTTYLEVHHVLPLSQKGEDTFDNTTALCPNCHRKRHYNLNLPDE